MLFVDRPLAEFPGVHRHQIEDNLLWGSVSWLNGLVFAVGVRFGQC